MFNLYNQAQDIKLIIRSCIFWQNGVHLKGCCIFAMEVLGAKVDEICYIIALKVNIECLVKYAIQFIHRATKRLQLFS